jgi:tRNA A-37 threonylcarbamoyl transferase component Bud32
VALASSAAGNIGAAPTTPGFGETPTEIDLPAGTQVGEYVIEDVIGRGGFGVVYRAVQPLIAKLVAIKVLSRKFSADREIVSRFVAEARAVNQIRHRHIIDIFSFGQLADGHQYYVMEHLEGEPLDRYLSNRGRLSLEEALPILRAVGRALDAAHAKGIAHRDLKPENIFIARDTDGDVFPKLLDFGVAKLLGNDESIAHRTGTGVPIGTPLYMSPEQCRGRDIDHRTDIYAFGILVYRLLTGAFPFEGDMVDILHKQVHAEPPPPSSIVPMLPPAVDTAVAWMMRKDPAARPGSLVAAVGALQGEEIVTSSLKSTVRPVAARPRRRWLFVLAPLVGAMIGAVTFFVVKNKRGDERVTPPSTSAASATPVAVDAGASATPMTLDAAPVRPAHVIITIAGVPEGTEVSGLGVSGVAPGPVQMPYGTDTLVLTFKADGFVPASATVVPDKNQPLTVKLKKKPRTQRDSQDPERLDDPFRKSNP